MSWQPDPRPDWVTAVNAGEILPISLEADRPLDPATVLGEAATALGLTTDQVVHELEPDREPFDLALDSLERDAQLSTFGRWYTRRFLLRQLVGRWQMRRYAETDPGVWDEQIEAPLIVVGAPRTGTTFLHRLLAMDGTLRAPEGWELLYPAPPPDPDSFENDPRIDVANWELSMPQQVSSKMLTIHRYSGRMHKECLSAMTFSFRSEEFISRYHSPRYRSWLHASDMTPAYEMHRRVLQLLQRKMPGRRWVLKSPVHLNNLETLLRVYPDAKLIVTHRDPVSVLASVTSLVATLRWALSDHVDYRAIGRYHADLYTGSLDRLAALTDEGFFAPGQIAHCRYDDLTTRPAETVGSLYEQLGLSASPELLAAIAEHTAANRREDEPPHTYSADDLGLDRADLEAALARYRRTFEGAVADVP